MYFLKAFRLARSRLNCRLIVFICVLGEAELVLLCVQGVMTHLI